MKLEACSNESHICLDAASVGKLNRLTFAVFVVIGNTSKQPEGGFVFSDGLALLIAEPCRWRDRNTRIAMR